MDRVRGALPGGMSGECFQGVPVDFPGLPTLHCASTTVTLELNLVNPSACVSFILHEYVVLEEVAAMTHDVGLLRKPVQATWQKSPIMFPTKVLVNSRDEDRVGCLRSALWCLVAEVGIGLAGFVGWKLWLTVR